MTAAGWEESLREVQRWARLWSPDFNVPAALSPLVAVTSLLALIITTGLALGSFAVLIVALLGLYLLLTQVFGFRFEIEGV